MKKLFIYYSLSGNGDAVANHLKKNGYDIRKVETNNKLPKNKFLCIFVGGFKGMVKYKDKLIDFDSDISKFDEIVIGSPIWCGSFCAPINTVLDTIDLTDKKVSFILWSASGEENKAMSIIKEKYNCDVFNLKEPLKNKEELKKIKA